MTMILRAIFASLLFAGCQSVNVSDLIGKYESAPLFPGSQKYAQGEFLFLNSDSTYFHSGCGNIDSGYWKINLAKDSLFLYCTGYRYKNDSLNKVRKPTCNPSEPFSTFSIRPGGSLLQRFRGFYLNLVKKG